MDCFLFPRKPVRKLSLKTFRLYYVSMWIRKRWNNGGRRVLGGACIGKLSFLIVDPITTLTLCLSMAKMESAELWQCFKLSEISLSLPAVGKAIASPIRLGEDKTAATFGVARFSETRLRFYLFPRTLHKFGLDVKRVNCTFDADHSQLILYHKKGKEVSEELSLDPLIKAADGHKSLNLFMRDVIFKPDDKHSNLPLLTLRIYVSGITDSFQCQLMDSESDDPLINLIFLNSFGDVAFRVSGLPHSPVKAPKVILAARSPALARLFVEKSRTLVDVCASAKTFRSVLNFLVRGRLTCGVNEELSTLADAFEMKSLQEICREVKAMDPVTDLLELDSLFAVSSGESRVRLADILNVSEGGKELWLATEAFVSSTEASCCLIKHVYPVTIDWTLPGSVRWSFEDATKEFRFHATLHKDRDEDGPFVAFTLRNFQRAPTYSVKKVNYFVFNREHQGRVIAGELTIDRNESQMKRWKGRQSDWTRSLGSNVCLEFNVLVETTVQNYKFSMRDLRYSDDVLHVLHENKWPDIELNIGGKVFPVHRAIMGQTELATALYKFQPHNAKPPEDPVEAAKQVIVEFSSYLQHALEPLESFTIPEKIRDMNPEIFQTILDFLYGRKLRVSPFSRDLLTAAEDLQVKTLIGICRATKDEVSDFESLIQGVEWL